MLVLASGSPRRRELLARFGLPFEVRPADVDESVRPGEAPEDLVRRLAVDKAQVALASAPEADVVVLAADTVVTLDGEILGKPVDEADAARMLARLSARTHLVLTGLAVARRSGPAHQLVSAPPEGVLVGPSVRLDSEVEATEVTMTAFGDADIAWYVATGEPLDKAGAYGIQGHGGILVASIRGSWDNVVGLPLATTHRLLAATGMDPLGPEPLGP